MATITFNIYKGGMSPSLLNFFSVLGSPQITSKRHEWHIRWGKHFKYRYKTTCTKSNLFKGASNGNRKICLMKLTNLNNIFHCTHKKLKRDKKGTMASETLKETASWNMVFLKGLTLKLDWIESLRWYFKLFYVMS